MKTLRAALFVLCAALVSPLPAAGYRDDPAETVNVFRSALVGGDTALALSLLAPEVLIYESGGEERSREEYAAAHLKADMKHLAGFYVDMLSQKSHVRERVAWVTTRIRYVSKSTDKPVENFGTETVVLERLATGWQIVHVHWSSSVAGASQ